MHQRSFTTTLVARTAAAAAAVPAAMFGSPPAATAAAPLPVYGAPGYTAGVGGYQVNSFPNGVDVNDAGTAVGWAGKGDAAGNYKGNSVLRWTSAPTSPVPPAP